MGNLIEVRDVCKTFRVSKRGRGIPGMVANLFVPRYEKRHAVKEVSFDIEEGEMVGFIGPNGAGKSTTIKMLSGILYPDSGSLQVAGYVPYRQRREYVAKIGVVFGQKSQLQWDLPVIDSFELLKAIYRIPDEVYRRNLDRYTEMLNMSGFLNQPVRQLSLGQRMRADIVAALLHSPRIVFFDEPTIGVDVVGKEVIRGFLRELNERDGMTMIFTTHDMQDIEKTCRKLLIIDDGSKVYDGSLEGIRSRYSAVRQLDVEFAGSLEVRPIAHVTIQELDAYKKRFLFESAEVEIQELMNHLLSEYPVRDLNITEPAIEGIIRRIYGGEEVGA